MPLHSDEKRLSMEIGGAIRAAIDYDLLTDVNVAAANTNAGLSTAIDTALATIHGDARPAAQRFKRAISDGNSDTFSLQDADILNLASAEALADLTENDTEDIRSHYIE